MKTGDISTFLRPTEPWGDRLRAAKLVGEYKKKYMKKKKQTKTTKQRQCGKAERLPQLLSCHILGVVRGHGSPPVSGTRDPVGLSAPSGHWERQKEKLCNWKPPQI